MEPCLNWNLFEIEIFEKERNLKRFDAKMKLNIDFTFLINFYHFKKSQQQKVNIFSNFYLKTCVWVKILCIFFFEPLFALKNIKWA